MSDDRRQCGGQSALSYDSITSEIRNLVALLPDDRLSSPAASALYNSVIDEVNTLLALLSPEELALFRCSGLSLSPTPSSVSSVSTESGESGMNAPITASSSYEAITSGIRNLVAMLPDEEPSSPALSALYKSILSEISVLTDLLTKKEVAKFNAFGPSSPTRSGPSSPRRSGSSVSSQKRQKTSETLPPNKRIKLEERDDVASSPRRSGSSVSSQKRQKTSKTLPPNKRIKLEAQDDDASEIETVDLLSSSDDDLAPPPPSPEPLLSRRTVRVDTLFW